MSLQTESGMPGFEERPRRQLAPPAADTGDLVMSAAASLAAVWVVFHLAAWDAPFGFVVCAFLLFLAIYAAITRVQHGVLAAKDRLATVAILAGAMAALLPLFLIIYFVLRRGLPVVLTKFPHFFTSDLRLFGPTDPVSKAGVMHAIVGTLMQVGLAALFTIPVGILAATYLNEVGGRFAGVVRTVADAMTGLPTVIAGLFVYFAIVKRYGFSGVAGSMALSVVMLPTVVRASEEVLRIVSNNLREAALALGAPEWRMVVLVVLPTARAGLVTASILGVARGVGETAPVLLTTFGDKVMNLNPFSGPQASLPVTIYTLIRSPVDNNVDVAWGGALVLVSLVLLLFAIARTVGSGGGNQKRRTRQLVRRLRQPRVHPPVT